MSSLEHARNAPQTAKRSVAASSARPRVQSSRVGATDSPELGSEVRPQDSVSNAPSRKTAQASLRTTGSHRSIEEKRAERTHITTKEIFQIRTRKPTKLVAEDRGSEIIKATGGKRDLRRAKDVGDEAAQARKGREALR